MHNILWCFYNEKEPSDILFLFLHFCIYLEIVVVALSSHMLIMYTMYMANLSW